MTSKNKQQNKEVLSRGIIVENPIFRLVLGMCSVLALSANLQSALGMGLAVLLVLILSNIAISLLRKIIPSTVRIPAYIVIVAAFVTMIQLLLKAYLPVLDQMLGIYLPLIVVNCLILGRAEVFAAHNSVGLAFLDALSMGLGYILAICSIAFIRELLGAGTIFGLRIIPESYTLAVLTSPAGGFFVLGLLMAIWNYLARQKDKPVAELNCANCPALTSCQLQAQAQEEEGS